MNDIPDTFASLLRRKVPLPPDAQGRLAFVRSEFQPLSDVLLTYGAAMYSACPLEITLKMILNFLQDLGKIDIKGKGRFKESILDSKAMLGELKEKFCDYLRSQNIPISESFFTEIDRCHQYRNDLAHNFWSEYGNACNATEKAEQAIMILVGCMDVFHHINIELLDALESLATAAAHPTLVEFLEGLKNVHKNRSSYGSQREFFEACYRGGRG